MSTPNPSIADEFDLQVIFGLGFMKGMTIEKMIGDLSGDYFKINLHNRMFIRGITEETFEVILPNGHSYRRQYSGDEKMWMQQLAISKIQEFLRDQEIGKLKSEIAMLKAKSQ